MGKQFLFFCLFLLIVYTGKTQSRQLQYYLDEAIRNSPLLKDFQNQADINHYDSLLIRAAAKPQVNGSSFHSYAPVIKGVGYDAAITNGGNFNALIGVNKPLVNKKNMASQFEYLQLQSEALNNSSKLSEQELKRVVINQYIAAYGSLQQLNFNQELNQLLSREEIILKKLTQGNVYKQTEYLSFLVTMQQQELLVKQLHIQYQADFSTLQYLCGITDTSINILQHPGIVLALLPAPSQSVFFHQFELDSLKLTNEKRLVDMNYRPSIHLFADAGFNSSLAYTPYKNFGTSFGLSLSVPIYDGKQKKIQYSKIDVAERTRKNYQSFFNTQYKQQIAQLTRQLSATDDLINDISKQLGYSKSLIEANGKLLEAGEVRITDYLLAVNNYLTAQSLLIQNTMNRLLLINQLNYWNR